MREAVSYPVLSNLQIPQVGKSEKSVRATTSRAESKDRKRQTERQTCMQARCRTKRESV